MTVYLVCEGEAGGLDDRVLDELVIQHHTLAVQTAPSGGSGSLGAVREYLLKRAPNDVAISVRDRDYVRTRAQAHVGWGNQKAPGYIWRRHEIENYLLDPVVVLALFNDRRAAGDPWALGLPATEADVLLLLQAVAVPLLENHAAEVLRVELQQQSTAGGNLQFGLKPPPAQPGATVAGQTGWVPALQQEAARLCAVCAAAAGLPQLQPGAIAVRYQVLLAQFQAPVFLASGDFLHDMGGHELMDALAAHLLGLGAPPKFTSLLGEELLRVLAPIYQPAAIYQPDDFQELAVILGQY